MIFQEITTVPTTIPIPSTVGELATMEYPGIHAEKSELCDTKNTLIYIHSKCKSENSVLKRQTK